MYKTYFLRRNITFNAKNRFLGFSELREENRTGYIFIQDYVPTPIIVNYIMATKYIIWLL